MRTGKVKIWQELVSIPTYEPGAPEKNPMFLEKRVYQGSSGVVYPYPVTERVSDEKTDREWTAVFLENDFVKIMVLPELGGRVQMAYDITRERHFIYYNQVITRRWRNFRPNFTVICNGGNCCTISRS